MKRVNSGKFWKKVCGDEFLEPGIHFCHVEAGTASFNRIFYFCFSYFPFLFVNRVIHLSVFIRTHIHLNLLSVPLPLSVSSGWGSKLCTAGRDGGEGGHTDPAKCKRRSSPDSDACQHSGHLRHQLVHSLSDTRLLRIHRCIIAILQQCHLRYTEGERETARASESDKDWCVWVLRLRI